MKKPHSLYLSALAHNRLSTYVDNALDGAGSLSGLFAFIEERTQAMLGRETDVPQSHPANEKFEELSMLDYRHLRQPLIEYIQSWDEFSSALPWFEENPVGAHILALNLLTEFPSLWEADYGRRDLPRHHLETHAVGLRMAIERIRDPYVPSVEAFDRSSAAWRWARPILGRDRIDFIVADRQVPVSIYLDSEAHQEFYAAFGNRFFTKLEHTLINLLEDPEAVVDIEPAAVFLELGLEGVDLDELEQAAREVMKTMAKRAVPATVKKVDRLTDDELTTYSRNRGYESLQDPALLREGLEYLYLRRRDVDRSLGFDTWNLTPNVAEGTLATLHLANRLGLIDGSDSRLLPQRIVATLSERFGITEIVPTRDNAFRLLVAADGGGEATIDFTNAVDMHMWALFVAYARHCLAHVSAGHQRFSHGTLATLAEGDLFPRVGVIEAFTGTKAQKTQSGRWQLRKGRKLHAELDHQTFFRVSEALDGLVQLRDPITAPGDWDHGVGDVDTTQKPHPYSYAVSPDVIERVLFVLDTHDGTPVRQALKEELQQSQPRRGQARTRSRKVARDE